MIADQLTPFDLKLEKYLQEEFRRMDSEWFFPWFRMSEGSINVDDFYGGRISYGHLKFEGTPRQIYWSSVSKYLSDKMEDLFEKWKTGTTEYNWQTRLFTLNRTYSVAYAFAHQIITHAADVDRRLRGAGYPENVDKADTGREREAVEAHLLRLKVAFDAMIDRPATQPQMSRVDKIERFLGRYPNILKVGGSLGLGGFAVAIAKWFTG